MRNPHVLVVPYPAQGHIIPLLELSKRLVNGGLNVTFVVTKHTSDHLLRIVKHDEEGSTVDHNPKVHVAMIREGLSLEEMKRPGRLTEWVRKVMPRKVEEVIEEINRDHDDEMMIRCVVADQGFGWALEIAEKKGIKRAVFCTASAAMIVQAFSVQKFIDDGIIDQNGIVLKKQMIKLSAEMPTMNTSNFVWASLGNKDMQKNVFKLITQSNTLMNKAQWFLCNSTYDIEPAAFKLAPQVLPIGPLISSSTVDPQPRDQDQASTICLEWLDQQRPNSVVYIAFGSFAVLNPTQLGELALSLELSNRPFLWVVKDCERDFPDGFLERVANRALVVNWAPQQRVLAHSSVACFVSHCGWNSTVEGVSNGLTFLCWPYFADQFVNQSYVCDVWRVGLGFDNKEDFGSSGVVMRDEIWAKLETVLCDEEMRKRALALKEMVLDSVKEGGESSKNFRAFVEWIKSD